MLYGIDFAPIKRYHQFCCQTYLFSFHSICLTFYDCHKFLHCMLLHPIVPIHKKHFIDQFIVKLCFLSVNRSVYLVNIFRINSQNRLWNSSHIFFLTVMCKYVKILPSLSPRMTKHQDLQMTFLTVLKIPNSLIQNKRKKELRSWKGRITQKGVLTLFPLTSSDLEWKTCPKYRETAGGCQIATRVGRLILSALSFRRLFLFSLPKIHYKKLGGGTINPPINTHRKPQATNRVN